MANLQLAKNLFYLRTISGLKQDDIADIFNISRQACSNYETSTRTPDLGYLASFAAHFHVTMDQLILCDLEAEHFIPGSEYPSGMRETVTPYMQGIEKNTGNYIYLTEEEVDLVFAFRSSSDEKRKLATGFLHSDKELSFLFSRLFLSLPVQIHHELHSLLFQYLLPESVP